MPVPNHFILLLSLLFLLLPSTSASILTPSPISIPSPNITCITSGFYNCSGTCPCNFSQNYYHYTVIAIAAITMVWCILFTIAFFCVKQLRQKPGEIIFIATIANFLLALSFGFQNVKLLIFNSPSHKENDAGCFVLGACTMFMINAISVYQLVYYGYNATTLRKPINASRITRRRYHAASFLATGILTLSEVWFGSIGRTILGTCSLKTTSSIVLPIATNAVMMILDFIIAYMIRRNFKKRIRDLNARQTKYIEHYLGYIIVLCIILLGIGAIEIDIATKMDDSLTSKTLEDDKDAFNSLQICSFLLINLVPLILILGRIRDPTVWRPLKKKIKSLFRSTHEDEAINNEDEEIRDLEPNSPPMSPVASDNHREDLNKRLLGVDALPVINLRPLGTTQSSSLSSSGITSSGGSFPKSFKACEDSRLAQPSQVSKTKDPKMFYSIFAGIHYYWHLQKNAKKDEKKEEESRKEERNLKHYKKEAELRTKFTLHESLLKNTVPQIYREIKTKHYKIRFGIFTVYAPGLFSELIENDDVAGELQSSLELMQNFSNVISAGTELNKSQFLTYNSKFMVRHISKNDRRTLMRILPKYMYHMKTKPYSLLTRIYGLFRFEVMNPYQQVNWLIMKNITQKSSSSIERMYEIKGVAAQQRKSTTEIMSGPDGERAILRELGSLGDEYFEKNEHSIYVDANVRGPLLETIKNDIEFLVGEGLYDYSLNVSIVNRAKMTSDQRLSSSVILEVEEDEWSMASKIRTEDEEEKCGYRRSERGMSLVSQVNIQNPFFALKSTKENLYYSLEIDSYLTRFDWGKKFKYYWNGCKDEEGCLQPPDVYGMRLQQYVKQIISDKDYSIGNLNHETDNSRSGESSTLER